MTLHKRYLAFRAALSTRFPYLTLSYYRERKAIASAERAPLWFFQSAGMRRVHNKAAKKRADAIALNPKLTTLSELPAVTICLVTYNASLWIDAWVKSIQALEYPKDKLWHNIVDNGSSDNSVALLKDRMAKYGLAGQMKLIVNSDNLGFGASQDIAITHAKTKYVLVVNPDAILEPQSLKDAVRFAEQDNDEACAWEFAQIPFEHPKYYDPVTLETSWNAHSCALMRRSAYVKTGGYDPKLFMYGEDTELSYRFRAQGYILRYLPWARVHHDAHKKYGLRQDQSIRSLAANLCIRRRYGKMRDRLAGYALLALGYLQQKKSGQDNIKLSWQLYRTLRPHFPPQRPRHIDFPFNGVNFDLRRSGVDTPINTLNTKHAPKVSIITRVHKNSPLLLEAIGSVAHQTYPNIEHIIICDGDVKLPPLDAKVIKVNFQQRTKAANAGAKAATGEYLLFLDYDDLIFADHIEGLVGAMNNKPGAVCSYSYSWEAMTTAKHQGRYVEYLGTQISMESQYKAPSDLNSRNFFSIQSVLIRRTAFDKVGGLNDNLDYLEDWDLWKRLSQIGAFIPYPKTTSINFTPASLKDRIKRANNFII